MTRPLATKSVRIAVTLCAVAAMGLVLWWDVYTHAHESALDFVLSAFVTCVFGVGLGWLWPWNEQKRDPRGRFIKSE